MSNPTAKIKIILGSVAIAAMTATATLPSALAACAPKKVCNPCAAKKGCGGCNPCAAKKGCGGCNPCAAAKKGCGGCNPCAAKKKN